MPVSNVLVKEYAPPQQIARGYSPSVVIRQSKEPIYPDSDGAPMGETGIHVHTILHLYGALLNFFYGTPDVYIAANMFMYYEKGNPKACKSPDVMVIKGIDGSYQRRSFKIWEENATPQVVFEITSKSTILEDLMTKSKLYAKLGVREYFLFDPLREYLEDQLRGFSLEDGEYVAMPLDANGALTSRELGLILIPEDIFLRLINPQTNEPVPDYVESLAIATEKTRHAEQADQRAAQADQRAEQEKQRADVAETELARLRALLNP